MTREEKNEIIQGVIDAIKAQSQDILELPSSDNIEEVKTLLILAKRWCFEIHFYGRF